MHLLDLGKTVKKAISDRGSIAWQYNTVGVSDGITMGTEGENYIAMIWCRLEYIG